MTSPKHHLLIVLLLGGCLRLAWLLYCQPEPVSDFEHYRTLAQAILDHGQFGFPQPTAFRPPGYPLLLAVAMVVSRSVFWLSMTSVLLSTLICYLVYQLSRRLFRDEGIARRTLLVCVLNPTFIFFSPILGSEHPSAVLVLFTTLVLLGESRPWWRAGLAGGLLGLGILTRGEGLFYAPVLLGLAAFRTGRLARQVWQRVGRASFCLLVAGAVVSPWYLRNIRVMGPGAGLTTNAGTTFYEGHNPQSYGWRDYRQTALKDLDEVERNKKAFALALAYCVDHPAHIFYSTLKGTYGLYRPSRQAVYWSTRQGMAFSQQPLASKALPGIRLAELITYAGYLLLLGLAGMSVRFRRQVSSQGYWILGGFLLLHWLGYAVLFWGYSRYRYFPEVIFCFFAGVSLQQLWQRWHARY